MDAYGDYRWIWLTYGLQYCGLFYFHPKNRWHHNALQGSSWASTVASSPMTEFGADLAQNFEKSVAKSSKYVAY